jgi:hypothetical protein
MKTQRRIKRSRSKKIRRSRRTSQLRSRRTSQLRSRRTKRGGRKKRNSRKRRVSRKRRNSRKVGGLFKNKKKCLYKWKDINGHEMMEYVEVGKDINEYHKKTLVEPVIKNNQSVGKCNDEGKFHIEISTDELENTEKEKEAIRRELSLDPEDMILDLRNILKTGKKPVWGSKDETTDLTWEERSIFEKKLQQLLYDQKTYAKLPPGAKRDRIKRMVGLAARHPEAL